MWSVGSENRLGNVYGTETRTTSPSSYFNPRNTIQLMIKVKEGYLLFNKFIKNNNSLGFHQV